MKIGIIGCTHGELDIIYDVAQLIQEREQLKLELILCCGDFQAVRNRADLRSMAVPQKYQQMNTFYKYYSGEKKAPILTIVIGGNHEASNYMQELPYGGWLAPNIYYMGYAGVVNIGGLRIAGLSGIYKPRDYNRGHYEFPPYNDESMRSVYHIRNLEVFRLKQLSKPVDIVLSHDWPANIYEYGDKELLLKIKPFFKDDIKHGELGSPPAEELLLHMKPRYWFSAHLHVKFSALVEHDDGSQTRFLALDKCLPNRDYLQVLDIEPTASVDSTGSLTSVDQFGSASMPSLALDPEWLCVLRSTNKLMSLSRTNCFMPGPGAKDRYDFRPTDDEIEELTALFEDDLTIPENFERNVPVFTGKGKFDPNLLETRTNPQTSLLCEIVDLIDPNAQHLGVKGSLSDELQVLSKSLQEEYDYEDLKEFPSFSAAGKQGEPTELLATSPDNSSSSTTNAENVQSTSQRWTNFRRRNVDVNTPTNDSPYLDSCAGVVVQNEDKIDLPEDDDDDDGDDGDDNKETAAQVENDDKIELPASSDEDDNTDEVLKS